jgi:putative membrane protein
MMKTLSAFPALMFLTIVTPFQALAQTQQQPSSTPPDYYWPGPWHMWGPGYGWPFWGMFPMMLLFLVLFFIVIFFFARGVFGARHHWSPMSHDWSDPTYSALQILNERFAKGEIQKPEYDEKKAAILSGARR